MEVNAVRRQERIRQAAQPQAKAAPARSTGPGAGADRLTLSKEAVARLEEQKRQFQERLDQDMEKKAREQIGENEESGDGMLDAMSERLKVMQKCMKIASRIMAGDKVPPQDEMYLMQNDPVGYKLAMAARKVKKNPKEWESEADKEEPSAQKSSGAAAQEGGEAAVEEAGGDGSAGTSEDGA